MSLTVLCGLIWNGRQSARQSELGGSLSGEESPVLGPVHGWVLSSPEGVDKRALRSRLLQPVVGFHHSKNGFLNIV